MPRLQGRRALLLLAGVHFLAFRTKCTVGKPFLGTRAKASLASFRRRLRDQPLEVWSSTAAKVTRTRRFLPFSAECSVPSPRRLERSCAKKTGAKASLQ